MPGESTPANRLNVRKAASAKITAFCLSLADGLISGAQVGAKPQQIRVFLAAFVAVVENRVQCQRIGAFDNVGLFHNYGVLKWRRPWRSNQERRRR